MRRQNLDKYLITGLQLVAAFSLLALPTATTFELLIATMSYFFMACIGGTITYHRLISHKAFKSPQWFKILGLLCGAWGGYGSPLSWAAVHREHHRFVDLPQDPHSPLHKSWWQVQWLSALEKPNLRYVPDLFLDKLTIFFHRNYLRLHLLLVILIALISPRALLYAYLWPAFFVWNLASLVNVLGHRVGYRNWETKDSSQNNWILGILVFGEGWHNNHHAKPNRFSFRKNWWELDISEWVIRLIRQ